MNKNKYLQELTEKDVDLLLTEEDKLFIEQLVESEEIKYTKKKAEMQEEENDISKRSNCVKNKRR